MERKIYKGRVVKMKITETSGGGIRISDKNSTYIIYAELEYKRSTGHGGGYYASDVRLKVIEEKNPHD